MTDDVQLVGIDLGTSGIRIVAYDRRGDVIGSSDADLSEQSQREWERVMREGSPDLENGEKICSVDSTSGTIVMVDKFGEMVFPPVMYYETASKQAKEIEKHESVEEARDKGISISSTSPLPKIMKIREENPKQFENVEWILSPTTWVLYRLKYEEGKRWRDLETDWTNALKFGADITKEKPSWFKSIIEDADLSPDLLPEIRRPGTFVGSAESDLAEEMTIEGADLYQGLSDGNSSALAMGCLQPGDYGISCGSTSVPKFISSEIETHEAIYYHRHPIEGYIAGAAFETGIILRWFCNKVLGIGQEEGLKLAQDSQFGAEYGFFPQGDRSPFFDPDLGNVLGGFHPNQDLSREEVRGRFVRGIATGIAMEEYQYLPLFEKLFDLSIDRVRFLGGGSPSEDDPFTWWNELRASVWDREVIKMEPRTTVGSLIPASLTASVYEDVDETCNLLLREEGKVDRHDEITSKYKEKRREFFDKWKGIRDLSPLV
ncbi:hypothetical protein AKJ39_00245 [candidate division MSBL1 archaeon SCGC-AAA259J03]|uniref:Carbohydrate kinase FGGY N-terminal domain-containing protein n=1 Tax=candidate division MSBL1 archaeon SCGC-AAA259J03 TaxID=1698269 RepID=A0A656YY86_9EURY|nr:hypothetical protein AKJ39_00245 [candidate division MSBL1 archaeon SCGC-AAA259J03]